MGIVPSTSQSTHDFLESSISSTNETAAYIRKRLTSAMPRSRQKECRDMLQVFQQHQESLLRRYTWEMESRVRDWSVKLNDERQEHESELSRIREEHRHEIEKLQKKHDDRVSKLKQRHIETRIEMERQLTEAEQKGYISANGTRTGIYMRLTQRDKHLRAALQLTWGVLETLHNCHRGLNGVLMTEAQNLKKLLDTQRTELNREVEHLADENRSLRAKNQLLLHNLSLPPPERPEIPMKTQTVPSAALIIPRKRRRIEHDQEETMSSQLLWERDRCIQEIDRLKRQINAIESVSTSRKKWWHNTYQFSVVNELTTWNTCNITHLSTANVTALIEKVGVIAGMDVMGTPEQFGQAIQSLYNTAASVLHSLNIPIEIPQT